MKNLIFKKKKMQNILSPTRIKQFIIEKSKKTFYLVLKKKPLSVETIEKLNIDFEKRLECYIDKIILDLEKMNPQDPEKILKYISLQATVQILNRIMNEKYINMTDNDKKTAEQIFNKKDENKKEEDKKQENNDNFNDYGLDQVLEYI